MRADLVHLPGIFVKLHAETFRDALPFLDQGMQQMTKIAELLFFRKMKTVRKLRKSGHRVDRCVEDELRPLRRACIFESHRFEARGADQRGSLLYQSKWCPRRFERAHPRRGVEFIAHLRVGDTRAAHERGSAHDVSVCNFGDDFFASQAVLRRQNGAILEKMRDRSDGVRCLRGLAGNDSEIELW